MRVVNALAAMIVIAKNAVMTVIAAMMIKVKV
jgi:hypothetical protein